MRQGARSGIAVFAVAAMFAAASMHAAPASKQIVEGHRVLASIVVGEPFGQRVATLRDVTGDGIDDIAIGQLTLSPSNGGTAIHSGADGSKVLTLVPFDSLTQFPNAVADVGDIDRDGVEDVAVGTTGDNFDSFRGAVRVFSGHDGHPLRALLGTSFGEQFGFAIAGAGDVDGDGAADLLIGAPMYFNRGRAYLYSGRSGELLRAIEAPAGARGFGWTMATLRDVDGDRIDDFAVGAPAVDLPAPRSVFVFSAADGSQIASALGAGDSSVFGVSIGSAGDFDGDGAGDFYVGDSSVGGTVRTGGRGRYQIFSGRNGAQLFRTDGAAAPDEVGRGGGSFDFNHDGFSDVMVASRRGAATDAGNVAILAGPDGRTLQTFTSDIARERFGDRTAPIGDVDGDGRPDLIANTFGAARPLVYVLAGSTSEGGALVTPVAQHAGLWFDPTHAGEGFVLEIYADGRATVYFFTYTRSGAQRYLVGGGVVVGKRIVFRDFVSTSGGRLGGAFDPALVQLRFESQLVLSFDSCDSGWAEYTIDGMRDRQRLTRLTGIPGVACGTNTEIARNDYSGSFFDPNHSGEGWILQSIGENQYEVLWFTYDDAGNQQWFIGGGQRDITGIVVADALRPIGGRFGRYFRPAEVTLPRWGSLRFTFPDCGNAQVSWDGIGARGTTSIVRLSSLAAVRCTP